jgi:hypothetical protein
MEAAVNISAVMEICIQDAPQKNLVIFGPRRSGTNYLQQIALLNTLNCFSINMDATFREHQCRLLISGYSEYGSKHSLRDKALSSKLRAENINLVVIRRDIRAWLYSRYAYQLRFCKPDFALTAEVIDGWIQREYMEFLGDLCSAPTGIYHLFIYEDLDVDLLRSVLLERGLIITRFPIELTSSTIPGGGTSGKRFKPRALGGNDVIEAYIGGRPDISNIQSGSDLFKWAGVSLHSFVD